MVTDPSKPVIAATCPQQVTLPAGSTTAYCTCGRSQQGVYCDGAHRGTHFRPSIIQVDETTTATLCQCRHSANLPYCDGSHQTLV